jgi:hypothetical protein
VGSPTVRVLCTAGLVADPAPVLVTIPDVEILEVGEDWHTSTGDFTWTEEDLLSAIESQADPAVRTPVLKLGHVDPRFDGEPSFGRLENLRTTNNGQTLVCDLVSVPKWLAEVMGSAYPRRSIEGEFFITTQTGNNWSFILTALSLLGAFYPAITTLEDLKACYGETPPPMIPAADTPEVTAATAKFVRATRKEPGPMPKPAEIFAKGGKVKASATFDDMRRAYYESLESNQYWWWIRSVLINPLQLVVDDDEGSLYLIDVTANADDTFAFGDPQPVKVEYVAASAFVPGQLVAASYDSAVKAGRQPRAASDTPKENGMQQWLSDLVKSLGKDPTGMTEEEAQTLVAGAINSNIDQPKPDAPADPPAEGAEPATPSTDGNPSSQPETPATAPGAEPATTPPGTTTGTPVKVPDGYALIDAATLQGLQETGKVAATFIQREKDKERDDFLDKAVRAGKFPPARRDHYKTAWAADPVGTRQLIDSLAEGLVPVAEIGEAGKPDGQQGPETTYPSEWAPAVAASRRMTGVTSMVKAAND